jgi:hypothetical protein
MISRQSIGLLTPVSRWWRGTLGLPPVVESVHKLFETEEWQGTSLARFRNQAIAANMGARRVPQQKP